MINLLAFNLNHVAPATPHLLVGPSSISTFLPKQPVLQPINSSWYDHPFKVHSEQIVLKEKKKSTMSTVGWACFDESRGEVEVSDSTCWEHRVLITAGQIITRPPSIFLPFSLPCWLPTSQGLNKQRHAGYIHTAQYIRGQQQEIVLASWVRKWPQTGWTSCFPDN